MLGLLTRLPWPDSQRDTAMALPTWSAGKFCAHEVEHLRGAGRAAPRAPLRRSHRRAEPCRPPGRARPRWPRRSPRRWPSQPQPPPWRGPWPPLLDPSRPGPTRPRSLRAGQPPPSRPRRGPPGCRRTRRWPPRLRRPWAPADSSGFTTGPRQLCSQRLHRPPGGTRQSVGDRLGVRAALVDGRCGLRGHGLEGDRCGGLGVHPRAAGHEGRRPAGACPRRRCAGPCAGGAQPRSPRPPRKPVCPDWGRVA